MDRRMRHSLVFLFALTVALSVANFWRTASLVNSRTAEVRTLCAEQRDVGTAPITAQASKVGVKLVVDFRNAYAGLRCGGHLPPPSPELLRLAGQYGVKVGR